MLEKLNELFITTFIAELAAFAGSVILLWKSRTWKPFIFFLLFIIIIETIGWHLRITKGRNGWLFNVIILLVPLFYLRMFQKSPYSRSIQPLFTLLLVAHLLFFGVNYTFFQGIYIYNSHSQVFGLAVLIAGSFIMFTSIMKSNQLVSPLDDEYFWLASAILISSLGKILINIFKTQIDQYYYETQFNLYRFTINIMNVFLYGVLLIAFICHQKRIKTE